MGNNLTTVSQGDQSERPRLEQISPHPQHSTYGKPVPFNLRREVFLSHSGKDKEFVRFLHKALCSSYPGIEVAFFDEETIPKAEAVSMENILEEARTSKLGVLVLTDDFFTNTRNPMLELEAFVGAEVKLLPLFFKMSVEQFKEKKRQDGWVEKWRNWPGVNLKSWEHALSLVSKFSGLEYCKIASNQCEFIDKVVKQVTRIIGPANPLSNARVIHGRDRLCQVVDDIYKEAASKRFSSVQNASNTQAASTSSSICDLEEESSYVASTVVGIHGFPGLGKTTLSKWLCDFYHRELSGRVCYIDVGSPPASPEQKSASYKGRLQHVLSTLSPRRNANYPHQYYNVYNDQLENLLRHEFSSMKDPVFLAIDNIETESQEEADLYLNCDFPEGSRIFITSRSEGILANLSGQHEDSFSVTIDYMPPLEFTEARNIFVQEFPLKLGLRKQQELDDVSKECVKLCTIHGKRYHPLMLKSLAAFIRWDRSMNVADWKGRMAKLRSKGIDHRKGDVWSKVFSVFEMAYELLSGEARKVFLDLALSYEIVRSYICLFGEQSHKWISTLHSHLGETTLDKIILHLQDTCFIEREELKSIDIPKLMVDFGKYKAQQEDMYVVVDKNTVWPDHDRLPSSARHISISRVLCKASETQLDLRDVEGVEVLHLVDNAGLQEVLLSPTTCAHLRSLIVIAPKCTTLRCTLDEDWPSSSSLPPRRGVLKWTKLQGDVSFQRTGTSQLSERGLLVGNHDTNFQSLTKLEVSSKAAGPVSILVFPRNVEVLYLSHLPNVQNVDLTACANLKVVQVGDMPSLIKFIAPEGNSHRLPEVKISGCTRLLALSISANTQTNHLSILNCPSLQTLSCRAGSGAERACTSHQGRLWIYSFRNPLNAKVKLEGLFGRFSTKDAEVDCSVCKAKVSELRATARDNQATLASVQVIRLRDAQHIGFFVSALFEAEPEELKELKIECESGGDCGCDQNAPHFGPLPWKSREFRADRPCLSYRCPQVRDLGSVAQWRVLKHLDLEGCTSVKVWPDFIVLSGLTELVLRNTSLKEWPAAVLLLPRLSLLDLCGCRKLPPKELIINSIIAVPESMTMAQLTCRGCSLISLTQDVRKGIRDGRSVADALDALSPELLLLFDRGSSSNSMEYGSYSLLLMQKLVVELMYCIWFGGAFDDTTWYYTYIDTRAGPSFRFSESRNGQVDVARRKMRGLLCSESFLSLPFRACKELMALNFGGWISKDEMFPDFLPPDFWLTRWNSISRESADGRLRDWTLAGMAAMGIALLGEGALNFRRWMRNDWINSLLLMSGPYSPVDTISYKLDGAKLEELEDWVLAGVAATAIVLVGEGAMSFKGCRTSLHRSCVLNVLQSPFKDKLFNRIGHLKHVRRSWTYFRELGVHR